jgi:hypothetical protein
MGDIMFGKKSATAVDERPVDGDGVDEDRATQRLMTRPRSAANSSVVDEPVVGDALEARDEPVAPARWTHVSLAATFSLVIGTLALAATLTGLLAPIGFAAGVVAVALALGAIVGVRRPHVTGHGIVITGLVFGVVAIVLSLLAINGQLSWLSNRTDEIAVLHNWLNNHMHWLRRW